MVLNAVPCIHCQGRDFHRSPILALSNFVNKNAAAIPGCGTLNQTMPTLFTRARAARKVIGVFDSVCGIPRSGLSCDAGLESDLGVCGDDAYALLDALHAAGIDMSGFDCHDHITPEGLPLPPMLGWLALTLGCSIGIAANFPAWPDALVVAMASVCSAVGLLALSSKQPRQELRVRDLIAAAEAGRWVPPVVNERR